MIDAEREQQTTRYRSSYFSLRAIKQQRMMQVEINIIIFLQVLTLIMIILDWGNEE